MKPKRKTKSPRYVATEKIVFESVDGHRKAGVCSVAAPTRWRGTDYKCMVICDDSQREHPVFGASSFQSLVLALWFAESQLSSFVDAGGKLLDSEGSAIDLRLMFARDLLERHPCSDGGLQTTDVPRAAKSITRTK